MKERERLEDLRGRLEARRRIVALVRDHFGVDDVQYELRVVPLERGSSAPATSGSPEHDRRRKTAKEVLFQGEDVQTDVYASTSDGTPLAPPDLLVPGDS